MIKEDETVAIGWCDNGLSDGKFTEGIVSALITQKQNGTPIHKSIRVQGNQIARQRQVLFDHWADEATTDWLLWVDSDIVLNPEALKLLYQTADADERKIVSGIYFISKEPEGTLARPFPAVFKNVDEFKIQYLHPLPDNEVHKIDSAGLGFVIMHKSIVPILREKYPEKNLFNESDGTGDKFIGEDISFFRKVNECGISVWTHTSALVKHIKRFSLDMDYYALYWSMEYMKDKLKEQQG